VRCRPIGKICVRRAALTERGGGGGILVNLQREEALPGHQHEHLVIGEGEEDAHTGGDEGDWRSEASRAAMVNPI
jgi:hypothetical protein